MINANIQWENIFFWEEHGKIVDIFYAVPLHMYIAFFGAKLQVLFGNCQPVREKTCQNMATYSASQFAGWVQTCIKQYKGPCDQRGLVSFVMFSTSHPFFRVFAWTCSVFRSKMNVMPVIHAYFGGHN